MNAIKRKKKKNHDGTDTASVPPIEHALTTNHDYAIANNGFFFDLSIWSDEHPIDDPAQPLGTLSAPLPPHY
jgi:hypothetical protein